jgi:hypothetical protein
MNGGIMQDFDARLASAKAKPRPHRDVTIILDQDAAAEREQLIEALGNAEKLDKGDTRLGAANDTHAAPIRTALEALSATLRDSMATLRFVRLPGEKWSELTTQHIARKGVEMDLYYGYNIDAVIRAAAAYQHPETQEQFAFRVERDADGAEVLAPIAAAQWPVLFDRLTGSEVSEIRDAIFGLNDYEPSSRIEALVKDFGAATRSDTK